MRVFFFFLSVVGKIRKKASAAGPRKTKNPTKEIYSSVYVFLFSKKEMICCWDVSGAAQCIFLTTASSSSSQQRKAQQQRGIYYAAPP